MSKAARTENNDIRGRKAVLRGGRCFRGAGQRLRIEHGVDHCFRFIDHHLGGSVPPPRCSEKLKRTQSNAEAQEQSHRLRRSRALARKAAAKRRPPSWPGFL